MAMLLWIRCIIVSAVSAVASSAFIRAHHAEGSLRGHLKQNRSALALEVLGSRTKQHHLFVQDQSKFDECGVTKQTTSAMIDSMGKNCPASCPLYVKDKTDDLFCSFRCVKATQCISMNPNEPVADEKMGMCRPCIVSGCLHCAKDGTDTCLECKEGWRLLEDGTCQNPLFFIWMIVLVVVVCIVGFLGCWLWSLSKRAALVENDEGLRQGLEVRSAAKLHKPTSDETVSLRRNGGKFVGTEKHGKGHLGATSTTITSLQRFMVIYHDKDKSNLISLQSNALGLGKHGFRVEETIVKADAHHSEMTKFVLAHETDGYYLKTEEGDYVCEENSEIVVAVGVKAPETKLKVEFLDERDFYPLDTNLMKEPIAGSGVLHLFTFEFMIIAWATCVVVAWVTMAFIVDTDFFELGTKSPGKTPRDNCIIIQWGYETQQRLMHAKYTFVTCLYIFTFLGCIAYAIRQLRFHQWLDEARISHKDYCAKLTGLPRIAGDQKVEKELKHFLADATGKKVLGVSICWDFNGQEDLFMKVIDADTEARQERQALPSHHDAAQQLHAENVEGMNTFDKTCSKWEGFLMSPGVQKIVKKQHQSAAMTRSAMQRHHAGRKKAREEKMSARMTQSRTGEESARSPPSSRRSSLSADSEEQVETIEVDMVAELEKLYTTEDAFVVFETEADRDDAIQKAIDMGGFDFQGGKLMLQEADCEPQTVNWSRITNQTWFQHVLRCFVGFLCICLALAVWCFCFYLPYARSVAKTDYAHGRDPNPMTKTVFGLVVVAGNAMMYVVCAEVSDRVGFKTQSKREICYMMLYCFACVFNVLLDLVAAYTMAYKQMVGMGMKTHDGEPLGEVDTFAKIFGTYAMQKSLGQILLDYSFPSTFLIPFLAEPFVVIVAPYQIMSMIIRSNPSIIGSAAEAYLASTPMDLSRYADLLLNLMLAVLMLFFPGGYLLKIFCGLIIAHIWIYAYDHYRVISSIPACDFATNDVDWWAQWMLSIPCGLIIACAFFKVNCEREGIVCWEDQYVMYWCFGLFFAHILVHTLVLVFFVPLFSRKGKPNLEEYRKCSEQHPCSWFSANPVHCLRSSYIYEHKIPCDYFILGKDHLLRKNPELHCFYHAKTRKGEEFGSSLFSSLRSELRDVAENAEEAIHNLRGKEHKSETSLSDKSPDTPGRKSPDTPGRPESPAK